jgi:hypothetical protein
MKAPARASFTTVLKKAPAGRNGGGFLFSYPGTTAFFDNGDIREWSDA